MKFSVCTDALFTKTELSFIERAAVCRKCGYSTAEIWGWWNKDVKELADSDIYVAALCTPFVSMTDDAFHNEYLARLSETVEVCRKLGCRRIISQVGNDTGAERSVQHANIVACARRAATVLSQSEITLVIEPLNTRVDHKGYYLSSSEEGFDIVREVDSPNVKLLFDIYHQQITEGDILRHLLPNLSLVGHIHTAGINGRHELWNGELDYAFVFSKLREAGYDGYIGLEYMPQDDPADGLRRVLELIKD